MKNIAIAFVVLALLPATVFAGGGTKNTTKITVVNKGLTALLVVVNPSGATVTKADFDKQGGRVLGAGESTTFGAKEGNNNVRAAYVDAAGQPGVQGQATVAVKKNHTATVHISGNAAAGPTFK